LTGLGAWSFAFLLLPSGGQVKIKNPPPFGSGFDKFRERSKPGCRADQQCVRQQQVEIMIHVCKISGTGSGVKLNSALKLQALSCGKGARNRWQPMPAGVFRLSKSFRHRSGISPIATISV
jgi:hypothetical protein